MLSKYNKKYIESKNSKSNIMVCDSNCVPSKLYATSNIECNVCIIMYNPLIKKTKIKKIIHTYEEYYTLDIFKNTVKCKNQK